MKKSPAKPTPPLKELLLCADDYAQNPAISEGQLALLAACRINAVSCLVNMDTFDDMHQDVKPFKADRFVGLHLNLTLGQPRSAMWRKHEGEWFKGLPWLIRQTCLRRLDPRVVLAELQAQLDVFLDSMQCEPDFMDGHHHVHQLPIVRDAVLQLYRERSLSGFLRNTYNGWSDYSALRGFPKPQALACLGGYAFQKQLIQAAIPANTSFAGLYSFSKARHYRAYFKRFLAHTASGGLIMCHPGHVSSDPDDAIRHARQLEWDYFMSDAFLKDMRAQSFQLMTKVDEA